MRCRRNDHPHGQYLLGAALGGGGFGTTYRALKLESVDPVRGEMVAVKEYFPHSIAARSDDGRVVPQRNDAKLFTNWRDKFVTEYNMLLEASRCRRWCRCWICSRKTIPRIW